MSLKIFHVECSVLRLDGIRAVFIEKCVAETESGALAMVEHFRTTPPAPVAFSARVGKVEPYPSAATMSVDPCHPMFWVENFYRSREQQLRASGQWPRPESDTKGGE